MKIGRFAQVGCALVGVFVLVNIVPPRLLAQDGHAHGLNGSVAAADAKSQSELVRVVRQATERYKDVTVAENDGYKLMFGFVSGPDYGAMGMHFVNLPLVLDGKLDPAKPEIVIYEPTPSGRLKLIGADYLVFADAWPKGAPQPELMGQLLHFFEAPNRFGLPPFYTLHVWAWKENPTGTFVNWHANVSCDSFSGQN